MHLDTKKSVPEPKKKNDEVGRTGKMSKGGRWIEGRIQGN